MEKVIVISGKAESGKDTFAKIFKQKLPDKRIAIIHYADHLKAMAKLYFGWDGKKDEKGRTLLQWLGTEKIRSRYPDFWVGTVANDIKVLWDDFDFFLIPDCRYLNEIEFLMDKEFPVFTLRINRPNHQNSLTEQQRKHISENALDNYPFHYVINVDKGLDKAEKEVEKFISTFIL